MADQYDQLVEQLLKLVEPGFGGQARPDLVSRVEALTREIAREGATSYIREKTAGVREWVGIACSPRRHAPWGLQRVEEFAYFDAYRLIAPGRPRRLERLAPPPATSMSGVAHLADLAALRALRLHGRQ
jgi:hypothetical protein